MALKIIVIDDEANIRRSLAGLLEEQGHRVTSVASGEEGLERIIEEAHDLMFLDIMLPGMSGLQVLEQVDKLRPGMKVIMISGHADLETAVKATKLGAYNFLEKPLNPEKVLLEVKNLEDRWRMEKEVSELKRLVDLDYKMIGTSPAMEKLRQEIDKAAPSEGRILIYGENGTGKELVAWEIHNKSQRKDKPFIKLNCAAIPRELIESELFGHEKGAFTGAIKKKAGVFEEVAGGTLLLDEIGDMAPETQAKLLRVLQENEFLRVGGTTPRKFNARIISATNKDLGEEIKSGRFREDLYFRLNVIPIRVPPLRERKEDIPILAKHFLYAYCVRNGKKEKSIEDNALIPLQNYHWPGNIRELKNLIERLVIMSDGDVISFRDVVSVLPGGVGKHGGNRVFLMPPESEEGKASLRERIESFERELLKKEFARCGGNVSRMAKNLNTDRANLHRKLKKYGIKVI